MISALAPAFVPSGLGEDEEPRSGDPAASRRTPPGTVSSRRGGKPLAVSAVSEVVSDDGRELSPSHHRRSLSEPRKGLTHRNSAPAESLTESLAAGGSAASRPKRKKVSHLYKTELCVGFMETGTCPYGASCLFAHGGTELRRPDRHPKYKTKKCSSYHNTGYCQFGDHCVFIHEPEDEEPGMLYSSTPASEPGSRTPYRKAVSSTPLISTTPLSEVSSTGATYGSGPGILSAAAVSASLASTLGSTSSYLTRTTAAATAAATLGAGEVSGNLDSDEETEDLIADVLEKGVSADFASDVASARMTGSWTKEHRRSHTISSSSPTTVFSGSEIFGPGLIGVPGEPVAKVKGLKERKSSGSYSASARLEFARPIAEATAGFPEPSRAFSESARAYTDSSRVFADSTRAYADSSSGRSLSMLGEEVSKSMDLEADDSARSSLASLGSRGGATAKVIGPSFSGRERKLSSSSASAAERSSSADRWEPSSVLNPSDKIIHHERSPSADRWKSPPKPIQPKRLKQSLSSDCKFSSEGKDYERDLSSSLSAIDISSKKRVSGTASMITPMVVEEDPSESMRRFSSGRASQSDGTSSLFSSYPSLFSLKSSE